MPLIKHYPNQKEVDQLFKLKWSLRITASEIAKEIGYNVSSVTAYFNFYKGSVKIENKIKQYINSKTI